MTVAPAASPPFPFVIIRGNELSCFDSLPFVMHEKMVEIRKASSVIVILSFFYPYYVET